MICVELTMDITSWPAIVSKCLIFFFSGFFPTLTILLRFFTEQIPIQKKTRRVLCFDSMLTRHYDY